jgi:hypothetical protein
MDDAFLYPSKGLANREQSLDAAEKIERQEDKRHPEVSASGAEGQGNEERERHDGHQGSHLRRSLHRDALCIRQQLLRTGSGAASETGSSHGGDIFTLGDRRHEIPPGEAHKFPGTAGITIRFRPV